MALSQEKNTDTASVSTSYQQLSRLTGREFYDMWLATQCRLIEGTYFGVLVTRKEDSESFQPVSIWPDSAADLHTVSELIEQVIEQECGLITELGRQAGDKRKGYALAFPVTIDDRIMSIVAININVDDPKSLKFAMQQLQWGCAWIELKEKKDQATANGLKNEQLGRSVDILASVISEESSSAAILRLVTELAVLFTCERVSIGFIKNKSVKIDQVSHSAQFSQRMNLVRLIESAMDESVDQLKPIVFPFTEKSSGIITIAHQALADQENETSIMTIPLYVDRKVIGAVTLERSIDIPFNDIDLKYCESITALTVTALSEKRKNDRWIFTKIVDSLREQVVKVAGPGHLLLKFILVLLVAMVLFFSKATTIYRLSADATLKGALLRAVVAPYEGYIDTAMVRAGDSVRKGQSLLTLDVRDFHLEQLRWRSQVEKLKRQQQEALAGHDRAALNVITAQLQQAEAQLQMVEMLLQRADIKAPFDGIIVSGDLSQRLGGAVTKGELLFEVSPMNEYRIDLKIRESRISDVKVGQHGRLYLSAIPNKAYPITIIRITPETKSEGGASYFIVEAELENNDRILQIGMEGVAKIEINRRKIISVWTRDLLDWLRLKFWSWSS